MDNERKKGRPPVAELLGMGFDLEDGTIGPVIGVEGGSSSEERREAARALGDMLMPDTEVERVRENGKAHFGPPRTWDNTSWEPSGSAWKQKVN